MKKFIKSLLIIVLAVNLLLSSTIIVFAGDNGDPLSLNVTLKKSIQIVTVDA